MADHLNDSGAVTGHSTVGPAYDRFTFEIGYTSFCDGGLALNDQLGTATADFDESAHARRRWGPGRRTLNRSAIAVPLPVHVVGPY